MLDFNWHFTEEHRQQLEIFARLKNTRMAAVFTINYCAAHNLSVPSNLVQLYGIEATKLLLGTHEKKRGRASGALESFRSDYKKFIRWQAVTVARYGQARARLYARAFEAHVSTILDSHPLLGKLGQTHFDACLFASSVLEKTPAFGSPEVIKGNYTLVRKHRKLGDFEFERICPDLLRGYGLDFTSFHEVKNALIF